MDSVDPTWLDQAGLSDEETAVVGEVVDQFRSAFEADLRAIASEIGIPEEVASTLPWYALHSWVASELGSDGGLFEPQKRVAAERAGRAVPPPTDEWSVHERLVRHFADVGTRFESKIAEVLGPERAHALRKMDDGWTYKTMMPGVCPNDPGLE